LFILKIFFLTSGKTPGFDGTGVAFDFNFANKILPTSPELKKCVFIF
jgi:hypothetical protein